MRKSGKDSGCPLFGLRVENGPYQTGLDGEKMDWISVCSFQPCLKWLTLQVAGLAGFQPMARQGGEQSMRMIEDDELVASLKYDLF